MLAQKLVKANEGLAYFMSHASSDLGSVLSKEGLSHLKDMVDYYYTAGAKTAGDITGKIRDAMGDAFSKVKDHLPGAIKDVQDQSRESIIEKIKTAMDDGRELPELGKLAKDLARTFVEEGVFDPKDHEVLGKAVHAELEKLDPNITLDTATQMYSGYGDYRMPSQDEVSINLRDQKRQAQLGLAIKDVIKNIEGDKEKSAQRSGRGRDNPTDRQRQLTQKLNELKKDARYTVTDPETQLKSALQASKTYYKNRMADLHEEISTGQRIVKGKTVLMPDAELTAIKAEYADLKAEHGEIFGKKELTDEQRLARMTGAAERSLANYQDQIAGKKPLWPGKKVSNLTSPEFELLKARRNAAKEQVQLLKDLADKADPSRKEAIANQAFITRTAQRIVDLQTKTSKGDFGPPELKTPIQLNPKARAIKAIAEEAKQKYDEGRRKKQMADRHWIEKGLDMIPRIKRLNVISGPITMGKLAAAGVMRPVETMIEGAGGGVMGKIPGYAGVFKRAPIEGGFAPGAMFKDLAKGYASGVMEEGKVLRTGKGQIDLLNAKARDLPPDILDLFNHIHAMIKNPTKRAHYEMALAKEMKWYHENGYNIKDEAVQSMMNTRAYEYAQRSIFMQDAKIAGALKAGFQWLERKHNGKTDLYGKALATLGREQLPIVKVPENIVTEVFTHLGGTASGTAMAVRAHLRGIESLGPEKADMIARHLKKGNVGLASAALGVLSALGLTGGAVQMGGYYQPGEKRDPKDVQVGGMRLFGVNIPRWMIHLPPFEVMQLSSTATTIIMKHLKKGKGADEAVPDGIMAALWGLGEQIPLLGEQANISRFQHGGRVWAGNELKSFIEPQMLQQIARLSDTDENGNTIRRPEKGFVDALKTGIPGLREKVPAKDDSRAINKQRTLEDMKLRTPGAPPRTAAPLPSDAYENPTAQGERAILSQEQGFEANKRLGKESLKTPAQREIQHRDYAWSIQAYNAATPEEKKTLAHAVLHAAFLYRRNHPAEFLVADPNASPLEIYRRQLDKHDPPLPPELKALALKSLENR